ncbi:uncharacterized mitochondrial protein AtMg00810-like [Zingiber officinale]|uniref:uncharacterized mitochondrial protein AtMg00810-like n=1 Tax=Zingiber officinale TaxID=94328 RepID=UPI001C4DC388|nr:uncharacterized mitochondrial protein AtMg00810-like [Zingiber officinale]
MVPPPGVVHRSGEDVGFAKLSMDSNKHHVLALFVKSTRASSILLSLYVDDMIITFDGIEYLKFELARCFAMKDLGLLRYFLGIEITSSPKSYLLSQSKYIANLFECACLTDNKIVDTPLETNARYSPSDDSSLQDPNLYRIVVESFVYLTVTRPDIAYTVHVVSQFVIALTTVHWVAVLHILRYL